MPPVYASCHTAAFTNKVLFEETDIGLTLSDLVQAHCIQTSAFFQGSHIEATYNFPIYSHVFTYAKKTDSTSAKCMSGPHAQNPVAHTAPVMCIYCSEIMERDRQILKHMLENQSTFLQVYSPFFLRTK